MRELDSQIVGASSAFTEMLACLRRVAARDAPVLIEGETGTGKELAARAIHYWSDRKAGPFVPVNCGALPDHLLEAELFGHERGAFTDARLRRPGLVAVANGGTLFLDEVDSLSAKAQVALLRFVQDQRYRPLGAAHELTTDVRLVTASNRPLANAILLGEFRPDLLYRLKILHLELPPLRARTGDAEVLARHFIALFCAKYRLPAKTLDASAVSWLRRHDWPGNVRELENWIHRELLMADGPVLGMRTETGKAEAPAAGGSALAKFQRAKSEVVRQFERDYVTAALRQARGNITQAAQIAGKERRSFGKLLKKHGIDRAALSD